MGGQGEGGAGWDGGSGGTIVSQFEARAGQLTPDIPSQQPITLLAHNYDGEDGDAAP